MSTPKNQKPFSELWISAADKAPALVNKVNPHFSTSTILLLHDERLGALPGYYLQWNRDFNKEAPHEPVKKGDTGYFSLKDDVKLENVVSYYPVDKLPLTGVKVPNEVSKEVDTEKKP